MLTNEIDHSHIARWRRLTSHDDDATETDSVEGFKPLPDGSGQLDNTPEGRLGSLGGAIDDLFQSYRKYNGGWTDSISNKPDGAMTTKEVLETYGPIKNWDVSEVSI